MGQQIIRQPDGRFAIFSSIVDGFLLTDATEEEILRWRADEAGCAARERTMAELERVKFQDKPYHQFTLTWDEAYAIDLRNYPPESPPDGGDPVT